MRRRHTDSGRYRDRVRHTKVRQQRQINTGQWHRRRRESKAQGGVDRSIIQPAEIRNGESNCESEGRGAPFRGGAKGEEGIVATVGALCVCVRTRTFFVFWRLRVLGEEEEAESTAKHTCLISGVSCHGADS